MNVKQSVRIPGPPELEGIYETPDAPTRGCAVVSHPHPLYGGTMVQPVVHRVAKACRHEGLATVRFNFRGVGASSGSFDGVKEWEDVAAAASFVSERVGDASRRPLVLAGYSFGARMSALAALRGVAADALILVAFPMMWEHLRPDMFDRLGEFPGPVLSICGEHDDIAPPSEVEAFFRRRGLEVETVVIAGSDHFFYDSHQAMEYAVQRFLEQHLASPGAGLGEETP